MNRFPAVPPDSHASAVALSPAAGGTAARLTARPAPAAPLCPPGPCRFSPAQQQPQHEDEEPKTPEAPLPPPAARPHGGRGPGPGTAAVPPAALRRSARRPPAIGPLPTAGASHWLPAAAPRPLHIAGASHWPLAVPVMRQRGRPGLPTAGTPGGTPRSVPGWGQLRDPSPGGHYRRLAEGTAGSAAAAAARACPLRAAG